MSFLTFLLSSPQFGVPVIFLLSSLSLPTQSLVSALRSPLVIPIQSISLLLIPLLNLLLSKSLFPSILPPPLVIGMLLLSALPTTVNMCIALTQNSEAHVPTAVTGAVMGNLLGIVATPAWWSFFTKGTGGAASVR